MLFFFFKQKTAYEMRISDWSSDVCSSDLRGDGVGQRLRHLLALDRPPAVREDALGRLQAGGHEEGGPVDGVEAQDILADHVEVGRPEGLEALRLLVGIAGGGRTWRCLVEAKIGKAEIEAEQRIGRA